MANLRVDLNSVHRHLKRPATSKRENDFVLRSRVFFCKFVILNTNPNILTYLYLLFGARTDFMLVLVHHI